MKAEKEEMHNPTKSQDEKIAKIKALSAEAIEDTKDIKKITKRLSQTKGDKSDDDDDEKERESTKGMDVKERKKMAVEMEKQKDKENKKKALEDEKAEEGSSPATEGEPGSAERITKILKMLEEEIVARSSKPEEPPAAPAPAPEKPCADGMAELKKYFSGKEGLKRS